MVKPKKKPDQPPETQGVHWRLLGVVHTRFFLAKWTSLGLDDDDLRELEKQLLERPEGGSVVQGTGGLRKVRFASSKSNKGKSGSERVCYAHYPHPGLIVLVLVYGKGEKDDLEPDEKRQIKAMLAKHELQLKEGERK